MILLYVAGGGALGAVLRFSTYAVFARFFGAGAPWGTFGVNVVGSFLIGFFAVWLATKGEGAGDLRAFLITGLLGGFTTFSAFSLDVLQLIDRKAHWEAAFYAFGSVGVSILFCLAGLALARGAFS